MKKHYVIGDVHGEYELLLALVERLPKEARLIFVGDLVNRGKKGREVIAFVRKHAFAVVKGNHEGYMQEHGRMFLEMLKSTPEKEYYKIWRYAGGVPILQTYQPFTRSHNEAYKVVKNKENIAQLESDLDWIDTLPLVYELGELKNYNLPVVVSHGNIGDHWHLKEKNLKEFEYYALGNRNIPSEESPIFNIYGHIAVRELIQGKNFVCVDTGCGKYHHAKLTAYCVETKETFSIGKEELVLSAS